MLVLVDTRLFFDLNSHMLNAVTLRETSPDCCNDVPVDCTVRWVHVQCYKMLFTSDGPSMDVMRVAHFRYVPFEVGFDVRYVNTSGSPFEKYVRGRLYDTLKLTRENGHLCF
ncbi:hypothetical protein [Paraburkholderia sp. 40]|uniref:hypothetical protein n=1 Tax=Paraburkholderia sp. 40 TaxID=2991059 RepID=UPI003D24E20F